MIYRTDHFHKVHLVLCDGNVPAASSGFNEGKNEELSIIVMVPRAHALSGLLVSTGRQREQEKLVLSTFS
jgi:hypothetical protein